MQFPLWIGKPHSEVIVTFDIGVQCVQCSAKKLAPHLAKFFPSTAGLCGGLKFVAEKNLAKNLELKTTKVIGEITTCIFTHSFRVKHVACSPSKVVLDLILLFLWTVLRSFPSLSAKKIHEEFDNNVCALNKLD